MNGCIERTMSGSMWKTIVSVALACLVAIGASFALGSTHADAAYAATQNATASSLKAGSFAAGMPNYKYAYRGKVKTYKGYYYSYDSRGYLRKNVTVKYSNCIIKYNANGRGTKYKNRVVKFKNQLYLCNASGSICKNREYQLNKKWYLCSANGSLVKGWNRDRFYSTSDGHRLSGEYKIWHSKTAYNRYYFNPGDGKRKLDFAYKGYYYRATDGVGIAFGSSEYNYLVFQELNRQRINVRMSALWWSGGSQYNGYALGCANMAMISYNDYMNGHAHANTNRMNSAFSWRSEYQDYICYSQFSCDTPRNIVNAWARTTGYYSPLVYQWTHAGIHTIYSNGRYYYTLELERNKTIR